MGFVLVDGRVLCHKIVVRQLNGFWKAGSATAEEPGRAGVFGSFQIIETEPVHLPSLLQFVPLLKARGYFLTKDIENPNSFRWHIALVCCRKILGSSSGSVTIYLTLAVLR